MAKQDIQTEASERLGKYRDQRQRFVELIRRQEQFAAQNPQAYRRKVVAFAMFGYGYIVFVLLILFALLAGLVYLMFQSERAVTAEVKIGIFLVVLIAIVVRSLFISIPPPEGRRVSRSEAPKLWNEVDALARMFNAPKVDEIVIDMDMNAAAAQRPRFGFFGGNQNYLLLGLPLMYALPPNEMRSVMAHEFGHFSGQHGKLGGWLYRLNETFSRIQHSLHQNSANYLFRSFYDWFQPRFDAISFAMRRQNEYEADAAAVRIAGSKAASRALMRLSYLSRALDEGVLDKLGEKVKTQPAPPPDAFSQVKQGLAEALATMDLRTLLMRDLSDRTGYEDTHPSLTDRLQAMSELPAQENLDEVVADIRKPIVENAADEYLGATVPAIVSFYNQLYVDRVYPDWTEQHRAHTRNLGELESLRARAAENPLSRADQLEYAFLTLRLAEPSDALPMFQAMVDANPSDAEALYGLGESKLTLGDAAGEEHLRTASHLNIGLLESATKEIAAFRLKHGNGDLDTLKEEFLERAQVASIVHRERASVKPSDEFMSTTFDAAQREKLHDQLKARKDLKRAYLVSKVVRLEQPQRFNVLIVEPASAFLATTEKNEKLADRLISEVDLPGTITIFAPTDLRPWKKKFATMADALLFEN